MAFRIPFNEHLVIEADTPADVRALIEEFGVTLGPRRALPPPIVGTEVVPTDRPTDRPTTSKPRRAARRPARRAGLDDDAGTTNGGAGELGARLLEILSARGPLSTGKLAVQADQSAYMAKQAMEQMATKGLVHSTGASYSQRWHLGAKGSSSPKEAESRRR